MNVLLLLPIALLLIIGLGALLSASSVLAIRDEGDRLYFFRRQLAFLGVGLVALVAASRIPYGVYKRLAGPLLLVAIGGLIATLVVGEVRGGARRWIEAGPVTIQMSEFAKFAVVVYLAAALSRKDRLLKNFPHVAWPVVGSVGLVGALVLLQPDLGTTILIAGSAMAILATSTAPFRHIANLAVFGGACVLALAWTQQYQRDRVLSFLDSNADPLGSGLQAFQSLVALGTGGWFGVGLGASRARWFFLPNAHTDFIFAIIGEETGLAGTLVVVLLFVSLAVVGTSIAKRAPDQFGRLLAVGLVAWLSLQALVNVGGVTGVLPITGVPLPFVSSGGSAMVANLAAVGVLASIARGSGRMRRRRTS